jgi:hypothetical protein
MLRSLINLNNLPLGAAIYNVVPFYFEMIFYSNRNNLLAMDCAIGYKARSVIQFARNKGICLGCTFTFSNYVKIGIDVLSHT